jgi:short-subunit dehydrogenase
MTPSTVLVTGASSGLGRGLALHYARAGATVHALARRKPELDALVAEAAGAPGRILPVPLDVTDSEALVRAIESAHVLAGGALDLVIANAGVGDQTPGWRMDWRLVKRIMDVNVSAACVTIAAALPAMVEREKGTVVAISSLGAFRGFPRGAAYSGSKAALHTFMESIRVDLASAGVKALTVYPGFVKTEMTAKNPYPMPLLMELEPAVRTIARGIERGSPVISFPLPTRIAVTLLGSVPRTIYEALAANRRRPKRKG